MSIPTHEAQMLAVFDGQLCLGHLLRRGPKGWECFDARDTSLGIYPSKKEAAGALTFGIIQGAAQ